MNRGARRIVTAATLAGSVLHQPASALADDETTDRASALYDQASAAQARGDYRAAARLFARADELAPDPAALEAALTAATLASDAPLAMDLCDRARSHDESDTLSAAVRAAKTRFADKVGTLRVDCGGCAVEVDGERFPSGKAQHVLAGEHAISGAEGSWSAVQTVTVPQGELARVTLAREGESADPPPENDGADASPSANDSLRNANTEPTAPSGGLSRVWFGVGVGLTVVAGGATIASGTHTLKLHDQFVASPSNDLASRGVASERATYILGGVTGVLGVTTALLGALAIDWSPSTPKSNATAGVVALPGGALLRCAGSF